MSVESNIDNESYSVLIRIIEDHLGANDQEDLLPLAIKILDESSAFLDSKRNTHDVAEAKGKERQFERRIASLIEEFCEEE